MFHPGILPSLMAVSIESIDFSVNIWTQILEKNFRHSWHQERALFYHCGSPPVISETMKIAFVAWWFCRTHYWAAKPQKRARTTMRNIRSGYIDSFVSLLINRKSTTGIVCITDYTLKFAPFVCFLCTSRFPLFKSIFFPIRVYLSRVNFLESLNSRGLS